MAADRGKKRRRLNGDRRTNERTKRPLNTGPNAGSYKSRNPPALLANFHSRRLTEPNFVVRPRNLCLRSTATVAPVEYHRGELPGFLSLGLVRCSFFVSNYTPYEPSCRFVSIIESLSASARENRQKVNR